MLRLWIGIVTFVAGAMLWYVAHRERLAGGASVPVWVERLGLAIGSLGLGTLAATVPGLAWSIVSSLFSLVAIVLMLRVLREGTRR